MTPELHVLEPEVRVHVCCTLQQCNVHETGYYLKSPSFCSISTVSLTEGAISILLMTVLMTK